MGDLGGLLRGLARWLFKNRNHPKFFGAFEEFPDLFDKSDSFLMGSNIVSPSPPRLVRQTEENASVFVLPKSKSSGSNEGFLIDRPGIYSSRILKGFLANIRGFYPAVSDSKLWP